MGMQEGKGPVRLLSSSHLLCPSVPREVWSRALPIVGVDRHTRSLLVPPWAEGRRQRQSSTQVSALCQPLISRKVSI